MAAGRCHRVLATIAGRSEGMRRVRQATWSACFGESLIHALHLERVIRDHDVLILGETGTGKEAIAHAIQQGTPGDDQGRPARSGTLNAAAVPDALIESELFGHVRGAFTGASENRVGRVRAADGGCFFLDEIGDLPLTAQVKLLRVIETDRVDPVGSDVAFQTDVRFLAATHQDLSEMISSGKFRADLYQRIAGNVINSPPLRQRREDIPDIGMRFVARAVGERLDVIDTRAIDEWLHGPVAQGYGWPGNVRELQNALRNLMLGLNAGLGAPLGRESGRAGPDDALPAGIGEATASLREVEDWYARRVFVRSGGNYARAARVLGIDRTTLRRKIVPG